MIPTEIILKQTIRGDRKQGATKYTILETRNSIHTTGKGETCSLPFTSLY